MSKKNEHPMTSCEYPLQDTPLSPKQKAILDAALELFSEKGYSATTTLEIAQKAHTSEKTLFKYFSSKQALFNHIFYPCLMNILNQPTPIDAPQGDSLYTTLAILFKEKINLSDDNPELFKLLIHQVFHDAPFRQVFHHHWDTLYAPYLQENIILSEEKKAYYDIPVTSSLSRIIFSLMLGYSISKNLLAPTAPYDNEKEIQLMLDILFDGMNGLSNPINSNVKE
ncbi:MAG: TetR/AcrR family transcriptional regulator [Cellulosilyticaceae bacterium]